MKTEKNIKDVNDRINTQGSYIRLNIKEVKVCKCLTNGKAPGPENTVGELIKYGTDKLYM